MLKDGAKSIIKHGIGKALDFGTDLAKNKIGQVVDYGAAKAGDFARKKINKFAGLGDGLYMGGSVSTSHVKQLKAMERMHGRGFFGDLLKTAGHGGVDFLANKLGGGMGGATTAQWKQLGVMHDKYGSGFFGDLIKTVAHGGVDFLANKLGGDAKVGDGMFGDIMKGIAHGGIDILANTLGGAVNPLANPNEALRASLFQKKVPIRAGSGLYQP